MALLEGEECFTASFGFPVSPGWSGFPDTLDLLSTAVSSAWAAEWRPRLFFADDDTLIGVGGWKGPPTSGTAEIGYAVAPSWQGRGIATALVGGWVDEGRSAGLLTVVAHTLACPSASTTVLERNGFIRTGTIDDPDEGSVWYWEMRLSERR